MNIEEGKEEGVAYYPPQAATAPYQGAPYYPPQPGPGPGYPVSETRGNDPLPCCGIGLGWLFFILGFFLGIIPWYVGAILLICDRNKDKREKPGYIACAIMAVIGTVLVVVILTATRPSYNN